MVAHYSVLSAMEKPANPPVYNKTNGTAATSSPDKSRKFEQEMDKVQSEQPSPKASSRQDDQPARKVESQASDQSAKADKSQDTSLPTSHEVAHPQPKSPQKTEETAKEPIGEPKSTLEHTPKDHALAAQIDLSSQTPHNTTSDPTSAPVTAAINSTESPVLANLANWQLLEKQAGKHQQDPKLAAQSSAGDMIEATDKEQHPSLLPSAAGSEDKTLIMGTIATQPVAEEKASTEAILPAKQAMTPATKQQSRQVQPDQAMQVQSPASGESSNLAEPSTDTTKIRIDTAAINTESQPKATGGKVGEQAASTTLDPSQVSEPAQVTEQETSEPFVKATTSKDQLITSDQPVAETSETNTQTSSSPNTKEQNSDIAVNKASATEHPISDGPDNSENATNTEIHLTKSEGRNEQSLPAQTFAENPANNSKQVQENVANSQPQSLSQSQSQSQSQAQSQIQSQTQAQSQAANMQGNTGDGFSQAQTKEALANQKTASQQPDEQLRTSETSTEESSPSKVDPQSDKPAFPQTDRQEQLAKLRAPKGAIFSSMMAGVSTEIGKPILMDSANDLFGPMSESDPVAMTGNDQTVRLTGLDAFVRTGQMPNSASLANAQAIAAQITRHARGGENRFEIRLDPAELGKIDVRLTIGSDGQARAHLFVERPETMDFLMRDQRMLERTLQQSGLQLEDQGLEFSLMDQQNQNQKWSDQQNQGSDETTGSSSDLADNNQTENLEASTNGLAQTYMATDSLNLVI